MALTFPNRSRSYDEAGQHIRFLGYDGMFEIPFLIEIEALANPNPEAATAEAGYLAAFDAARELDPRYREGSLFPRPQEPVRVTSADFRHQASRRF